MIQCGLIPVIHLDEVFRQQNESYIIGAAHTINSGKLPIIKHSISPHPNTQFIQPTIYFFFIEVSKYNQIVNFLIFFSLKKIKLIQKKKKKDFNNKFARVKLFTTTGI